MLKQSELNLADFFRQTSDYWIDSDKIGLKVYYAGGYLAVIAASFDARDKKS